MQDSVALRVIGALINLPYSSLLSPLPRFTDFPFPVLSILTGFHVDLPAELDEGGLLHPDGRSDCPSLAGVERAAVF
jgi:hypothetical protein